MNMKTELLGKIYEFQSVKEVLAKASENKSGDNLAGIAAKTEEERIAARMLLSEMTVLTLTENPLVPYEEDEVTRIIYDNLDKDALNYVKDWTLGKLREYILDHNITGEQIAWIGKGLTAEVISGVAKLMSNLDLIYGASKLIVTATCNTTIGEKGILASRLQPNHPSDSINGIMASLMEGLSYGMGDAVIGLNPVDDTPENIKKIMDAFTEIKERLQIPTQTCVLGHITTQMEAMKRGAKSDLLFQSIAGSEKGNKEFGVTIELLRAGEAYMEKNGTGKGPHVMYFETGQGSELSSNSHFDGDQMTMEARCYGLARQFKTFLVNSVVGFIGPEYLFDSKQVIRAGLEDHFMAKLTGIPMGVDVCYTNHMKADSNDMENLGVLLANAGCNFFIGIPGTDDVMLYYQSLGYHDIATLREITGKRPIREFENWMETLGLMHQGQLTKKAGEGWFFIDNEDNKTSSEKEENKAAFLKLVKQSAARNNIGRAGVRYLTKESISLQADHAAAVDSVTRQVSDKWIQDFGLLTYETCCENREVYLLNPDLGRKISDSVMEEIKKQCTFKPDVQIYISDGLSAAAIEANAKDTYLTLKQGLTNLGLSVGTNFFLKNGRVAAMDYVGKALGAKVTCVLIGERPGLATAKSMSAYITYQAYPGIVESARTVVSNIHQDGVNPLEAGAYIAELIYKMIQQGRSGVEFEY